MSRCQLVLNGTIAENLTDPEPMPAVTTMEAPGCGVKPNRYYTVQEAVNMHGTRYSVYPEVPAPISEPLKQMLWIKQIPAARVVHPSTALRQLNDNEFKGANVVALVANTSQSSWPVLWHEDERPRSSWVEQVELVERLGSKNGTPSLIPSDPAQHAIMIGMIHLIMGESEFFWMRRIEFTSERNSRSMLNKYSFSDEEHLAHKRVAEILNYFDAVLKVQNDAGSQYLVGQSLTAADVYWALASMIVIKPQKDLIADDHVNPYKETLATPNQFLDIFQGSSVKKYNSMITRRLRDHQDYIIRRYCNTPLK